MKADLLIFTPKHELDFKTNLKDFIEAVEPVQLLRPRLNYQSYYWPKVGNFTKFGVSSKDRKEENLLHESIIPFAKAYIKYQYIRSGKSMYAHFYALRALECTCVEAYGMIEISKLLPRDFDMAAQKARENMQEGAAYQAGMKLNQLRKFLIEKKMIKPFEWKNPFKKPKDKKDLTGDEGQRYREEKLPDENAIMAMATIFSKDVKELSDRDIFTSSTFSLLMSAPDRGSEPLYLKADCLSVKTVKKETHLNTGDVIKQEDGSEVITDNELLLSGEAQELVGIRWFGQKGYGYELKRVPSIMNPVVKEAIGRLQRMSAPARAFAKQLEETESFPRHALCPNVPEDQKLTKEQVLAAFGFDKSKMSKSKFKDSGNEFLKRHGIAREDYVVNLADINKIIRSNLPEGFPYVPFKKGEGKVRLKWSEALYACFANQFHKARLTLITKLWMPDITTLNEDLKPTKKQNRTRGGVSKGNLSIFKRHGLKNVEMRSHQPRHLLDTIASVNGMSDPLRAKWASRADPKHNRAYDHTTEEEYNKDWHDAQSNHDLADIEEMRRTFSIQIAAGDARSLQEYNTKTSLTVHMTEFGECLHSYIDEPCMKYRDCANCNELVCTKGDEFRLERIKEQLKKEKILLAGDKKALVENVNGAVQWYKRRLLTVERLSQLVQTLEDPTIPDGSKVKLANTENITHLDRALEANGKKRLPKIENFGRKVNEENLIQLVQIRDATGIESNANELPSTLKDDDDWQDIPLVENSWEDEI